MRSISIALVSALSLLAVQAGAQVVYTRTVNGSAASARIATIAPPPQQIVVVSPTQSLVFPGGTPFFFSLPTVVLPDGRVFADFGRGFEQIARSCATIVSVIPTSFLPVVQPAVSQPVVVQPQPGVTTAQQVVYTPVLAYETLAQQVLLSTAEQQTLAAQSQLVNLGSCWARTVNGRMFIARP